MTTFSKIGNRVIIDQGGSGSSLSDDFYLHYSKDYIEFSENAKTSTSNSKIRILISEIEGAPSSGPLDVIEWLTVNFFNSSGNNGPANVVKDLSANTQYVFNDDGTGAGYPPRALRIDEDGVLETVDKSGNISTKNVLQGEIFAAIVYEVTSNTTVKTQYML